MSDPGRHAEFFASQRGRSLIGARVELRGLRASDAEALWRAGRGERATYGWTIVPGTLDAATRYVAELLEEQDGGEVIPFVTVAIPGGEVIGATRFMTLRWLFDRREPDAVEIGGTWLAHRAQRTSANTEAKLLMLSRAFDEWRCARVDLKTDARNERSRRAIERLGASFEGVLRAWQPSLVAGEEGTPRDTAIYSIVAEEWQAVRERLSNRLSRHSASA